MAQIVSQGHGFVGQRSRSIGIFAAGLIAAAITIGIVWAAFAASTPKVVAPPTTSTQYMQEPGLLDQRSAERHPATTTSVEYRQERGVLDQRSGERPSVDGTAPSVANLTVLPFLTPEIQRHRNGER